MLIMSACSSNVGKNFEARPSGETRLTLSPLRENATDYRLMSLAARLKTKTKVQAQTGRRAINRST